MKEIVYHKQLNLISERNTKLKQIVATNCKGVLEKHTSIYMKS